MALCFVYHAKFLHMPLTGEAINQAKLQCVGPRSHKLSITAIFIAISILWCALG